MLSTHSDGPIAPVIAPLAFDKLTFSAGLHRCHEDSSDSRFCKATPATQPCMHSYTSSHGTHMFEGDTAIDLPRSHFLVGTNDAIWKFDVTSRSLAPLCLWPKMSERVQVPTIFVVNTTLCHCFVPQHYFIAVTGTSATVFALSAPLPNGGL